MLSLYEIELLYFRKVCDYMSEAVNFVLTDDLWDRNFDEVRKLSVLVPAHYIPIRRRGVATPKGEIRMRETRFLGAF